MRRLLFLAFALSLCFVADGARAASKHQETRRSAQRDRRTREVHAHRDAGADDDDAASDFWGSCLSGCFSTGCDVAGQAAVNAVEEASRAGTETPPPAPGLEASPRGPAPTWEPAPPEPEERAPAELPAALVPAGPGPVEPEGPAEAPPWMPGPAESPAQYLADEGETVPPGGVPGPRSPAPVEDAGPAVPGEGGARVVAGARPRVPAAPTGSVEDRDAPEAFGVTRAPAPPPAPPSPAGGGQGDVRLAGSWIFADLPNASLDARASYRTREPGPGVEVWYTGLWERVDETWDHLPIYGLRLAFGFGTENVRPELRLGGAVLHLASDDDRAAFDAGVGLEIRTGGEGAPWIDAHADALAFEGFTASDLGAGISFPGGPFYVRVGFRSVYLEATYAGPEVAIGLRN